MGSYWLRCDRSFVSALDIPGPQHRPGMPGTVWNYSGGRNHLYVFLAGSYKHQYDHGIDAGGWRAVAVGQLWRIIGIDNSHWYRSINECEYAAVYAGVTKTMKNDPPAVDRMNN